MTWVPRTSIWAWNCTGEDAVFFSQPSHADLTPLRLDGAAIARCGSTSRLGETCDGQTLWTHPIQCAHVARLGDDGSWACVDCVEKLYHCMQCCTPLPDGRGPMCPDCEADEESEA